MKATSIIGWDVGGAHLKAVLLGVDGRLQQVLQLPCALWQGLDKLEVAIDQILASFNKINALHIVTMTGELVDLFEDRQQGVSAISRVMHQKLSVLHVENTILFYQARVHKEEASFVEFSQIETYWQNIASANWHASACLIAQKIQNGLLIDIGSTTCDFVLLSNGAPQCLGLCDAARMQSNELIYTGVVRTPLMALAQTIDFQDKTTTVAAEYFATTADVYRLTEELTPDEDMTDTADGADKSTLASARRLARMIGHDVADAPFASWVQLAHAFKSVQLDRLSRIARLHLARLPIEHKIVKVVGAGAGSFLVRALVNQIADSLSQQGILIEYVGMATLLDDVQWMKRLNDQPINQEKQNTNFHINHDKKQAMNENQTKRWAAICLPAYAVAILALQAQHPSSI